MFTFSSGRFIKLRHLFVSRCVSKFNERDFRNSLPRVHYYDSCPCECTTAKSSLHNWKGSFVHTFIGDEGRSISKSKEIIIREFSSTYLRVYFLKAIIKEKVPESNIHISKLNSIFTVFLKVVSSSWPPCSPNLWLLCSYVFPSIQRPYDSYSSPSQQFLADRPIETRIPVILVI